MAPISEMIIITMHARIEFDLSKTKQCVDFPLNLNQLYEEALLMITLAVVFHILKFHLSELRLPLAVDRVLACNISI